MLYRYLLKPNGTFTAKCKVVLCSRRSVALLAIIASIAVICSYVIGCRHNSKAHPIDAGAKLQDILLSETRSVSRKDAIRTCDLFMTSNKTGRLTAEQIHFLTSVVKKTEGKPDADAYTEFAALAIDNLKSLPLDVHEELFVLAGKELVYGHQAAKNDFMNFQALRLLSLLDDKRSLALLQSSGGETSNTLYDAERTKLMDRLIASAR